MEKTPTNNHGKSAKLILLSFVFLLVGTIWYLGRLTKQIKKTQEIQEITLEKTEKKVDSVAEKVDLRYTSFDNKFYGTNTVVVDKDNNIIGEVFIHTNDSLIDDFYSEDGRRKTQFYYNMKNRELKIIEKK